MKVITSFLFDNLGLFFYPKKTIDDLQAHYKDQLLVLGLYLSLGARIASILAKGLDSGWSINTVFYSLASGYLAQFLFVSVILACIGLYQERVNTKIFWGLTLATDLIFLLELPIALLTLAFPFSLTPFTAVFAIWSMVLKLFVIQKIAKATFSKATILSVMPMLLFFFWILSGLFVFINVVSSTMKF